MSLTNSSRVTAGRAMVLAGVFLVSNAYASSEPVISQQIKEAAEKAANVTVPESIKERVNDLMTRIQSPEWKEKLKEAQKRAMDMFGIAEPTKEAVVDDAKIAGTTDRLYIFVSQSMPLETLRTYAMDSEHIPGAMLVMRGFVKDGQQMGPTIEFFSQVVRQDPRCTAKDCPLRAVDINIDPILFKRYGITHVPAFVYEENVNDDGHCSDGVADMEKKHGVDVVYGAASLRYVLELLNKENKHPGVSVMLKTLPGA